MRHLISNNFNEKMKKITRLKLLMLIILDNNLNIKILVLLLMDLKMMRAIYQIIVRKEESKKEMLRMITN